MNILVTTWCNRRECDFCFEQSVPEIRASGTLPVMGSSERSFLTAERYAELLHLAIEVWRSPRISLLGGEPTQHPLIAQFLREALALDVDVGVNTNGVFGGSRSEELRDILYSPLGRRLFFLVNAYLRPGQPTAEIKAIRENLRWMESACTLSVTACGDGLDLLPYANLIREFHLNKVIRISLSHPMLNHASRFADRERFHAIGQSLKRQGIDLKQHGIKLLCDCGFVACMFAAQQRDGETAEAAIRRGLGELSDCGILFKSVCHPLLDVRPDLSVAHCLPLSAGKRVSLDEIRYPSRDPLAASLAVHFRSQAHSYLFDACQSCGLRGSGECVGGCLSYRLKLQLATGV
ncbi:MAG: radical SAM protein [Acidobacteria bacterium]|nr:radical SAM protein [Acidobacteriota bacterium]